MSQETFTEEANNLVKKDDGTLAMIILVAAVVIVIIAGVYMLRNKMLSSGTDNRFVKCDSFVILS